MTSKCNASKTQCKPQISPGIIYWSVYDAKVWQYESTYVTISTTIYIWI